MYKAFQKKIIKVKQIIKRTKQKFTENFKYHIEVILGIFVETKKKVMQTLLSITVKLSSLSAVGISTPPLRFFIYLKKATLKAFSFAPEFKRKIYS